MFQWRRAGSKLGCQQQHVFELTSVHRNSYSFCSELKPGIKQSLQGAAVKRESREGERALKRELREERRYIYLSSNNCTHLLKRLLNCEDQPLPDTKDQQLLYTQDNILEQKEKLSVSTVDKIVEGGGLAEKLKQKKILILNLLAALYGLGNAVTKLVDSSSMTGTPASLTSAVRYSLALVVFLPALVRSLKRQDRAHIKIGVERGLWTFAHSLLASFSPTSTELSATSLSYTLTVMFIPMLQLGRSSKITWLATLASLSCMGVLEEEGSGWRGLVLPSFGNVWVIGDVTYMILQLVRSETVGKKMDQEGLNAIELAVLSILNIIWELTHLTTSTGFNDFRSQIATLPWCDLVFSGLICVGVSSWLELRSVHCVAVSTVTFIYMMIPVWGAFFSLLLLQGTTPLVVAVLAIGLFGVASFCSHCNTTSEQEHKTQDQQENQGMNDHISGLILTSQLKFPYYLNQAQALLSNVGSDVTESISADDTVTSTDTASAGSCFVHHDLGGLIHCLDAAMRTECTAICSLLDNINHVAHSLF